MWGSSYDYPQPPDEQLRRYKYAAESCRDVSCHLWKNYDALKVGKYVLQVCERCRRWRTIERETGNELRDDATRT